MSIAEEAADLLVAARRGGPLLTALPERLVPQTLEEAYAIQDAQVRQLGKVAGWKLAPNATPGGLVRFTPIPAGQVMASPGAIDGGDPAAMELEVEIAVTFGADLPRWPKLYSAEDVQQAIATMQLAYEVIGSRFLDRKAQPSLVTLADLHANRAVIVGAGTAKWQDLTLDDLSVSLSVDGRETAEAHSASPGRGQIIDMLVGLVNQATARSGGVRAGQVAITGARLRASGLRRGTTAVARAAGLSEIRISF